MTTQENNSDRPSGEEEQRSLLDKAMFALLEWKTLVWMAIGTAQGGLLMKYNILPAGYVIAGAIGIAVYAHLMGHALSNQSTE